MVNLSIGLCYLQGRRNVAGRAVAPPRWPPRSRIQADTGCRSVSLDLAGTPQWDTAGPVASLRDSSDPVASESVRMCYAANMQQVS